MKYKSHGEVPKSWKWIGSWVGRDGNEDVDYYKSGTTRIEINWQTGEVRRIEGYYEKYQRVY